MKKLTKALAVSALLATSVVGLVSCGNSGKQMDLFVYKAADPFISGKVVPGFEEALKAQGYTTKVFDANVDPATQVNQIKTAMGSQKVLLVNSATPNSADGIINVAKENKKPVVFFNREMEDAQLNAYKDAWFVGTARRQPGELQGEFVANQLIRDFKAWDKNGNGKLDYYILVGEAGNPEAIGRTAGARENTQAVFNKLYEGLTPEQKKPFEAIQGFNPKDVIQTVSKDYVANWTAEQAKNAVATLLSKPQDQWPEAIFANNDNMALGAMQALQAKGYNEGLKDGQLDTSKTILLTGCDGLSNVLPEVAKGSISFTVLQDGGKLAQVTVAVAMNILAGKPGFDGLTAKFPGLTIDKGAQKARVPYQGITMGKAMEMTGQKVLPIAKDYTLDSAATKK